MDMKIDDLQVSLPEDRMTMQEAVNHPFITKQGQLPPVDICVSSGTEEKL